MCCSKTAKETGTSSSRHYVSDNSSPSLLTTENRYEQDSTLESGIGETRSRLEKAAETASVVDFNKKSSRSAFIETSEETTCEAKHCLGERKGSWESPVHNPRWNAEWSEESFTDNEDGDNKVIPLKPRCSSAMRRLTEKDSTRQPKYKDEITLTDNIDSIVEKEIPEVPSSPSLLPTENGYEQDSTLERGIEETHSRLEKAAETASVVDFNKKSSRSAFIETSEETTCEAKHCLGEGKESWESPVHNPRWNAEWSGESFTDNEDGDNKVIPLKPRCSGAMRRLKKKDSTHQPKYKDEITLTDNIDSIVEKEIPEVPSSPSLLPTENGFEQDSTLEHGIEETRSRLEKAAETASVVDFNKKSSRSAFIETSVETAWEAKHRLGEKKESWESLVHNPRWNTEWSEEPSTDNEDGDNKVIPLKPRCSGAMRQLKKKDSTRQPKYKDEITLTDNIDSIVENEILEFPDDANAPAESPGPGSSHAGVSKPSPTKSMKTEDNKLATSVACSEREADPDAGSNETTVTSAVAAQGPKKIYAKRRSRKESDKMLVSAITFIVNNGKPS